MNGWKFIYAAERGHCADFHETQNLAINICRYPYRPTEFYRNRTKIVGNTNNCFKPLRKNIFHCTGFNETQVLNRIM